jgi:Uma2 family endonuclease
MSVATTMPSHEWTDESFDALPDDGYRRELIDGVLHVSPRSAFRHQIISRHLANALARHAPLEYLVVQDIEVKISDNLRYVPDVIVVAVEASGDGTPCRCNAGDVLLAVEIVSASSRGMDRILKPSHYASAGIPFYWRVEFEPELEIHTYELDPTGTYKETGSHDGELSTDRPWSLTLDVPSLFR